MDTIEYYNKYASVIFEDTVDRDMEQQRKEFLDLLEAGDTILDMGCGSGRDSLAFYEQGFDVTPLDASEEMCKLAEIHTGLEVLNMACEDMEFDEVFDGIWGSEALIHIPDEEMEEVLTRVTEALCQGGVLYLSFLKGDFEGSRGGLYINEYTREHLERMLKETGRLDILKIWETGEAESGEQRLNVLARKIS